MSTLTPSKTIEYNREFSYRAANGLISVRKDLSDEVFEDLVDALLWQALMNWASYPEAEALYHHCLDWNNFGD